VPALQAGRHHPLVRVYGLARYRCELGGHARPRQLTGASPATPRRRAARRGCARPACRLRCQEPRRTGCRSPVSYSQAPWWRRESRCARPPLPDRPDRGGSSCRPLSSSPTTYGHVVCGGSFRTGRRHRYRSTRRAPSNGASRRPLGDFLTDLIRGTRRARAPDARRRGGRAGRPRRRGLRQRGPSPLGAFVLVAGAPTPAPVSIRGKRFTGSPIL